MESIRDFVNVYVTSVLILIVMEDTHGEAGRGS